MIDEARGRQGVNPRDPQRSTPRPRRLLGVPLSVVDANAGPAAFAALQAALANNDTQGVAAQAALMNTLNAAATT